MPSSARTRSLMFDAALAVAAALLGLTIVVPLTDHLGSGSRTLVIGLCMAHAALVALRRVRPWLAFGSGIAISLVVTVVFGLPLVVLHLVPIVLVYSVASQFPGRASAFALGASVLTLMTIQVVKGFPDDLSTTIGNIIILAATWLIGWFVFRRQEYVRQLEARTAELQEAREELARAAVGAERLRIARELHDIVAHSLSMIAVQSGAGAHVIDSDPAGAKSALQNVERASRSALNEMRALVGMLRDEEGDGHRRPLPGLDDVQALVDDVSAAGPKVELQVHGHPRPLPPGLGLTAYRVIQESLTNVVRHAHADHVRVGITFSDDDLTIDVVDDGSGPVTEVGSGGLGLEGMRERIGAFGGRLDVGPLRDGGFRVHAELPVDEVVP